MKERRVIALFIISAISAYLSTGHPIVNAWDPNWNYDKGGSDWNFTNCNNTKQQQSPVDLINPGVQWWTPDKAIQFTFLPTYKPAVAKSIIPENYTLTARGNFGQVIATEPSDYSVTNVIKWNA